MCTVLLPQGVNPIAVNTYIISYHIKLEPFPSCGTTVPARSPQNHPVHKYQIGVAIKLCPMTLNISESSMTDLLDITFMAPKISRWP